jgi:hypothetical protein
MSDYLNFRGKCKEMSEALVKSDPTLTLVRGHYDCPSWGLQPHWWTKGQNGNIQDPTVNQFPSRGIGEYIEFDGNVECSNCGKTKKEADMRFDSNYAF